MSFSEERGNKTRKKMVVKDDLRDKKKIRYRYRLMRGFGGESPNEPRPIRVLKYEKREEGSERSIKEKKFEKSKNSKKYSK